MKITNITIITVGIALVVLVYALFQSQKLKQPAIVEDNINPNATNIAPTQEVVSYINFNSNDKAKTPVLKFKEGEKVKLSITSDIADEAHLHGYDISAEVAKNVPGFLEFEAKKSGRFPIELEKNGKEIAVIEIYPN